MRSPEKLIDMTERVSAHVEPYQWAGNLQLMATIFISIKLGINYEIRPYQNVF